MSHPSGRAIWLDDVGSPCTALVCSLLKLLLLIAFLPVTEDCCWWMDDNGTTVFCVSSKDVVEEDETPLEITPPALPIWEVLIFPKLP